MKEKHGLRGVRKFINVSGDTQAVIVNDGDGEVVLSISSAAFPAGLTPDEARFIASCLTAAADRVEG